MKLECKDIVIKNKTILKNSSVDLPDVGVFLLKGENGAGKTLLLNYLHLETDNNTVLVSQFDEIISDLSILENISMSTDKKDHIVIENFLVEYELDYLLRLNPASTSGGERRLICFLRGIFSNAKIILLDEPSNDLDYLITNKIIKIIDELSKSKLFIIATHDNRFDIIKNGVLSIKSCELSFKSNGLYNPKTATKTFLFSNRTNDLTIIKGVWKNKLVFSLLSIVLIFLSNYSICMTKVAEPIINEDISTNQVNVFLSVSQNGGTLFNNGALPMEFAKKINTSNLWGHSDISRNDEDKSQIVYDLHIPQSDNYIAYPIEFFVPNEREYIFTFDVYAKKINIKNMDEYHIRLPELMYIPNYATDGNAIDFNPSDFQTAVQSIIKDYPDAQPVFYSVILNPGYSYKDFISDVFNHNNNPHIYIFGKNTIEISNQLSEINTYKSTFENMIVYSSIFLFVELMFLLIYIKVKSKNIRTIINYGFAVDSIKKSLIKSNNKVILRILFILLLLGTTFFIAILPDKFIVAKYFPILSVILFIYIGYLLEKIILKICFNHISNWKYRN